MSKIHVTILAIYGGKLIQGNLTLYVLYPLSGHIIFTCERRDIQFKFLNLPNYALGG